MTRTEELLALAEATEAHTPDDWWREKTLVRALEPYTTHATSSHYKDASFIAAANPETIKQLVELVRLQHEALRSCGEGGSRLSHHHAQWFNAEEVDEAIEAFNKWEKGE